VEQAGFRIADGKDQDWYVLLQTIIVMYTARTFAILLPQYPANSFILLTRSPTLPCLCKTRNL